MKRTIMALLALLAAASESWAGGTAGINKADTAWIMASAALVLLMTPGLALFYGGMVRKKNVLGTIMHSFIAIAVITLQWIIIGYTLSFGPDMGGIIGGLDFLGLRGVGMEPHPSYATTIPHLTFMIYQCMFAIITPALISGAVAERIKFPAYLLFIVLWSTLVYNPVCHWIWGGGWMSRLGTMDFAGGLVVHLTSGISALVAALMIGARFNYGKEPMTPHNLPMTVMGAGILWFGWFGFNAGSALESSGLSTLAFVTTHIGAASATVAWVILEWMKNGKATMFGAATGSIAGLATITPAAGFVSPMSAIVIGAAAGVICFYALGMKSRLGYDDSLDAFGVHGVGGIIGTIGVGLFASAALNPAATNGLFNGNSHALVTQLISIVVVAAYSVAVTFVILKLIDRTIGLRITGDDEIMGLDISQHNEGGYELH